MIKWPVVILWMEISGAGTKLTGDTGFMFPLVVCSSNALAIGEGGVDTRFVYLRVLQRSTIALAKIHHTSWFLRRDAVDVQACSRLGANVLEGFPFYELPASFYVLTEFRVRSHICEHLNYWLCCRPAVLESPVLWLEDNIFCFQGSLLQKGFLSV